jgi:putative hydrolase of the HAD superfamily
MARSPRVPLDAIETWIFDLDNTLYPVSCRLFAQIEARMNRFISERLGLALEEAQALRKAYFREYGTTLRGLMITEAVDPEEFLLYVHEIDLTSLAPDPALDGALSALKGRKIIHTNASARHAENVLARLGVARHFSAILDIAAADYEPKPAPGGYRELVRRHGVAPERALMIEDIAKNLAPAAALGMTTVWLRSALDWASEGAEGDHVHHVIEDLGTFLAFAASPEAR